MVLTESAVMGDEDDPEIDLRLDPLWEDSQSNTFGNLNWPERRPCRKEESDIRSMSTRSRAAGGSSPPLSTNGTEYGFQRIVESLLDWFGAGGGGRTLTSLRPRDFESDKKGAEIIGRSCK